MHLTQSLKRATPSLSALTLAALTVTMPLGCTDKTADTVAITLDLSLSEEIPTVAAAVVDHDADVVTEAWLEASLDGEVSLTRPLTATDGGLDGLLLGLKAGRLYDITAVLSVDGVEHRSDPVELQTGLGPSQTPASFLDVPDPDLAIDGYLFTALQAGWAMPVVYDTEGDLVWWHFPSEDQEVVNAGIPLRDGSGVLYARNESSVAEIVKVSWDGTIEEVVDAHNLHHDLVELPDGTVGYIAYDILETDRGFIYGDRVMELAPDGTISEVWSIYQEIPTDSFKGPEDTDWSHSNSLDYDEASDSYYLGVRNFDLVLKIDRSSGTVTQRIGGEFGDFQTESGDTQLFDQQHQFQILAEDRILVFDNGTDEDHASRAVEWQLDASTGVAEQLWSYQTDPTLYCASLGDVIRFDDGDTLVVWSMAGQLDQVGPDGTVRWRLNTGIGAAFGYTVFLEEMDAGG